MSVCHRHNSDYGRHNGMLNYYHKSLHFLKKTDCNECIHVTVWLKCNYKVSRIIGCKRYGVYKMLFIQVCVTKRAIYAQDV